MFSFLYVCFLSCMHERVRVRLRVFLRVRMFACACVFACARVFACVCLRVHVCVCIVRFNASVISRKRNAHEGHL